jgi:hypothetical protein
MTELVELVALAARDAGLDAAVVRDRWPAPERDLVCVAIPHETFPFLPSSPEDLARTVALCTEQPATVFFGQTAAWADACGAAVDISPVGALALREAGVPARHLPLGWTPSLPLAPLDAPRPVDVLYLGSAAARREVLLAGYADVLWPYDTRLLIPPHWAKVRERPDFVVGARKRALLGAAKVLLSVRRRPEPYFEWARALDALAAGTVLVCEHGAGLEPLVPGEHLVLGAGASLGLLAAELLERPDELARIRAAARDRLLALPMGIGVLEEAAAGLVRAPRAPAAPDAVPGPAPEGHGGPEAPPRPPDDERAARAAREAIAARRGAERAAAAEPRRARGPARHDGRRTAAARVRPRARLPRGGDAARGAGLRGGAEHRGGARAARPRRPLPRGLGRGGRRVPARAAVAARPGRPPGGERGPARGTQCARAARPRPVPAHARRRQRVAAAVRRAPGRRPGRRSRGGLRLPDARRPRGRRARGAPVSLAWDPELLPVLNPIDALALLRADWLQRLGGYVEDLGLYGWEDWDLWCAVAEAGGHGVHVPQMLARYRRAPGSMLATTDLDQGAKRARLAARHPRLFGVAEHA